MSEPTGTHPFAPFEWMLSLRYLRARRKEGFISVIAGFSFLGIMLGVATLIIVMAVMNGFRQELLTKILGLNGHLLIQPLESPLTDWEAVADRVSKIDGIRLAAPIVEGQALASSPFNASGVLVRGIRSADLTKLTSIAKNIKQGTLDGFDQGQGLAIGTRLADQLSVRAGDNLTLVAPRGGSKPTRSPPCSRSACPNTTPPSSSCRSRRRKPISTAPATSPQSRSTPTTPITSTVSGNPSPTPRRGR